MLKYRERHDIINNSDAFFGESENAAKWCVTESEIGNKGW